MFSREVSVLEKTYKEYIREFFLETTDEDFDIFFEEQEAIREKFNEEMFRETPLENI